MYELQIIFGGGGGMVVLVLGVFYSLTSQVILTNHSPFRDPGSVCNDLGVFNSSISSKKLL